MKRELGSVALAALVLALAECESKPTCTLTSASPAVGTGESTTITATPNATLTIASVAVSVDKAGSVNPTTIALGGVASGTATFTGGKVSEDTLATVKGKMTYTSQGGTFAVDATPVSITVHPKESKDVSTRAPARVAAGTTICSVMSTGQGPPKWTYVIELTTSTPNLTIDQVIANFEVVDAGGFSSTPGTVGTTGTTSTGFHGIVGSIAGATTTITATAKDASKGGSATFDVKLSDGRRFDLSSTGPKK